MFHQDELWQLVGTNGKRLGSAKVALYDGSDGKIFDGATIMLYRKKEDKIEFLFQHRSKKIIGNADKWDTSAGGHVNFGEERLDAAAREAKEEINATIDIDKLEYVMTYVRKNCLISLYYYDYTECKEDFKFNDEEVEEVKWVSEDDLEEFWPNLKPEVRNDEFFKLSIKNQISKCQK